MKHICSTFLLGSLLISTSAAATPDPFTDYWASSIYPEKWRHLSNKEIIDFSYAGYMQDGMSDPTGIPALSLDVTDSTAMTALGFETADPTGAISSTVAINQAVDYVGQQGGGTVLVPEGTYKIEPSDGSIAIKISHDNVWLKGAGSGLTVLKHTQQFDRANTHTTRSAKVIQITPVSSAFYPTDPGTSVSQLNLGAVALSNAPGTVKGDASGQNSVTITASSQQLNVGDMVAFGGIANAAFASDYKMSEDQLRARGVKNPAKRAWEGKVPLPFYVRTVTHVEPLSGNEFRVDVDRPVTFGVSERYGSRFMKISDSDLLNNVVVSGFSIAQNQPDFGGYGDNDYNTPGTAAHAVHHSTLVYSSLVKDLLIEDIQTAKFNPADAHETLSIGMTNSYVQNVTVREFLYQSPKYRGAGGNGYGINVIGGDGLYYGNQFDRARHAFSFKTAAANGNVLFANVAKNGRGPSDFHMFLSVHNLVDTLGMFGEHVESKYRPWGASTMHGFSGSENIFWNTYRGDGGNNVAVISNQAGKGWLIGSRGNSSRLSNSRQIDTVADLKEGQGIGNTLWPTSLYLDQLAQRKTGLPAPRIHASHESSFNQVPAITDGLPSGSLNAWQHSAPLTLSVDYHGIRSVSGIDLSLFNPAERSYPVSVSTSIDGAVWDTQIQGHNTSVNPVEEIRFTPVDARYVKVTVEGNDVDGQVNIGELKTVSEPVIPGTSDTGQIVISAAKPAAVIKGNYSFWEMKPAGTKGFNVPYFVSSEYVHTFTGTEANESASELVFVVNNPSSLPQQYRVYLFGSAPDGKSDTVHITVNDEAPTTGQNASLSRKANPRYQSKRAPRIPGLVDYPHIELNPGINRVRVLVREPGARVGKIRLTPM